MQKHIRPVKEEYKTELMTMVVTSNANLDVYTCSR